MLTLVEKFNIAGYCRISVDDEMDRDNTSIENQKLIIKDFVEKKFPQSRLEFYEDRDRSGYTFEQREGYQKLRPLLMSHQFDILVVKDFSRFSRRNSRGLVELEDLRDAGVRIISIGDSIDYPTYDDWTAIQFRFLVNELPVTDTSKKVKSVINRRQNEGKWICSVPYGYVITNTKTMTFEIDQASAEVVRMIFELYNNGLGYKKIANHLTELKIPTPRMTEKQRKEEKGEQYKAAVRPEWSIITIQGIIENDFYIGTLRQGKYKRKKINGSDMKIDKDDHIVFEDNHEPIIDYRTFAITKEQLKKRSNSNYRGVKINDNVYSGLIYCGDCNSPMFSMSRRDLRPAYTCGSYHKRGLKGCTSHHTRVDMLDTLLKTFIERVKTNCSDMIEKLNISIKNESDEVKNNKQTIEILEKQLEDAKEELKVTIRQKTREIMRNPQNERILEETFEEMIAELQNKIVGLENQIALTADKRNTIIKVNRIAKTAFEIFEEILVKDKLDKADIDIIVEKITVFEDHVDIELKSDIDMLLKSGELTENAVNFKLDTENIENRIIQTSKNRKDKVLGVNVISGGDPLEIYTDKDGEVIFKKYSPIGELSNYAGMFAETISKNSLSGVVVTDKDVVIAAAGIPKKDVLEKRISADVEKLMESRQMYIYRAGESKKVQITDGSEKYNAGVAVPVMAEGDIIGTVMLLLPETGAVPSDSDIRLTQTVAQLLGKQLES